MCNSMVETQTQVELKKQDTQKWTKLTYSNKSERITLFMEC